MSRVNLLPHEIKQGQQARRRTFVVLLAGLVLVVLILLFWVVQGFQLQGVRDDIEAQSTTNESLQRNIADLQRFEDLQSRAQSQQQLLSTAYSGEISYAGALLDVSRVIPSDTYLTSLNLTSGVTPTEGGDTTSTEPAAGFVGTLTFAGATLHFESLSTWLTRLEGVEGWANPWASTINQDPTTAGAYTFDTSVDLTTDALTERGAGTTGG
jgi:Tfp pilus assembly protein PilN